MKHRKEQEMIDRAINVCIEFSRSSIHIFRFLEPYEKKSFVCISREGLIHLRLSRQAVYRAVTIDVRPQRGLRFFFKLDCIRISSEKTELMVGNHGTWSVCRVPYPRHHLHVQVNIFSSQIILLLNIRKNNTNDLNFYHMCKLTYNIVSQFSICSIWSMKIFN